jgi:hypothetical protein
VNWGVHRVGDKPRVGVIYMYSIRPVLWAVKPTVIYICVVTVLICARFDI